MNGRSAKAGSIVKRSSAVRGELSLLISFFPARAAPMETVSDINSLSYWDERFGSGDWARRGGHSQTAAFARAQVKRLGFTESFAGTICDFGCATGDAFPIYREAFPNAKLYGVDFASSAIEQARTRYPFATFICGTVDAVPDCDVIIASNVLEHLPNDVDVAWALKQKCRTLFVIVPYREGPLDSSHVRCYDDDAFKQLGVRRKHVYFCAGWTERGRGLIRKALANVRNILTGRALYRINRQIMYEL